MKKIVIVFISIVLFLFILINYMVLDNKKYHKNMLNEIKEKTEFTNINYVNKYGDNYLIIDNDKLYLIDNKYNIISYIDKTIIHENINNYKIIYEDEQFMYLKEIKESKGVRYEYYDISSYKLIKSILIGK